MAGIDCAPTIRPSGSFNAERIAAKMQKAIKGIGTDERTIIDVLTSHCNSQRQEIRMKYKTMYGRDLVDDLKKDLGGKFEDTCIIMFIGYYELMAESLYNSLKKSTNVKCIIDILCSHNNWDLNQIKENFREKYNDDIESLLSNKFDGEFKSVLVSLINANREESNNYSQELAEKEAKTLHEAGENRIGTDEDEFLRILCCRNYEQLKYTFNQYQLLAGHSFESAIDKEFSGELKDVFSALVLCINNMSLYFAKRLHECISGVGTDDDTLIRILVSRSEIDLEDIKDAYKKKYGKKLTDDIESDTSGDYKKLLLKILSP